MERTMDIENPVKDATKTAKQSIDQTAGQLQDVADQTTKNVGAVSNNMRKAVDASLEAQPYTTLAMVAALGFIVGAIWKA
jgi:ElaB/YqjD/DUF883 family membrane-anchored ribosome-binding protein